MTFEVGDKVKVAKGVTIKGAEEINTITSISHCGAFYRINGNIYGDSASYFEKVEVEDMYEDGWILNDGKVTIPDDAQKSMHEGSVVAFRKRKEVPLVFGDELIGVNSGNTYKFIRMNQDYYDVYNVRADVIVVYQNKSLFKRK